MALSTHPGGAADKAGLFHEALWGVDAFLAVLNGEASAIRIETPGDDGAEFHLERGPIREHWQAKRQTTSQDSWSIRALKSVLQFFFVKFRVGDRCVFASGSGSPELKQLTENARAAQSFAEFREHFLSKKRDDQFAQLRQQLGGSPDEEEVFRFLRAVTVRSADEVTLELEIGRALASAFQAPWSTTMAVLRDLYLRSVHEKLTAADIEKHLQVCGISRRRGYMPGARDRIDARTRTYVAGQRAKLIRPTPIRRMVADDVIGKIQSNTGPTDTLITSLAGGGKSACILQIVEGLQAAGVPVLALRLDTIEPVASTIALGEELGLGESPALVLADNYPGQAVALVVDQLDCVSATSGRHPGFFDTVAALRDDVLGLRCRATIHIVMACRKFDFEHDHRLKQLLAKDQKPIELGEFTADEVKAVVADNGGDISRLTTHQQAMLRLPQNLSLYVGAGLAGTDKGFTTAKELCDAYWDAKRRAVTSQRPEWDALWQPAIKQLAATMSDRQELSVPVTTMDTFPPGFLDRMASEGVLTSDGRRYGFGHETFFDYCFVRTLPNGGQDFVRFLEGDPQQLFRRAQLRQALAFLRDDNLPCYLESVAHLLRSERIRPHLKLLTLELLAAHPAPRDEELLTLMPWVESELACRGAKQPNTDRLASRIFDSVFASRSLFLVMDRLGHVHRWLHSDESWLVDTACLYLRWQAWQHAERVSELLEPFADAGGEWTNRLRYLMEGGELGKSRRYFRFFLRLLDNGTLDEARDRFASNGTFWSLMHGFADERPAWCAELAAHWIDRRIVVAKSVKEQQGWAWSLLDDGFGVDDLFTSARKGPTAFLEHVLPAVIRAADAFKDGDDVPLARDGVWPSRYRSDHISMSEAIPSACEMAFDLIGQSSPDALRPFILQLRPHPLYTANHLLMHAYLSNPAAFAEEAIGLLAAEPARLHCGYLDSAFWVSRQVIEKCSPHCTERTCCSLEAVVLAFVTSYERTKEGIRLRGNAAYNLVSALAESRRSSHAKTRLAEWQEKFGAPDGPPKGCRSYTVVSPIPEESAERMTDEQWLGAIAKYDSRNRRRDFEHPERGGGHELASMLQEFVKKQPERFATLALRFPESTEPSYFMNVLYGLKEATVSAETKLRVVRRVFGLNDKLCLSAALDVLGEISDARLPDDALQFVRDSAAHSDPESELWAGAQPYSGGDILTHGINTVRGHAAGTIRNLVRQDVHYLTDFSGTIDKLVADPSIAVRSVVASTLFAVARHDTPMALKLMVRLLNGDDHLLGTAYVRDFIQTGLREHFQTFAPTIERMLKSAHDEVKKQGATLACLARLYQKTADNLAEAALSGDEPCRLGACEVAKSNLLHPECRAWCEPVLLRLFRDRSKTVRTNAAGCFWHHRRLPDTPLTDFEPMIRNFLESEAFADKPTFLLGALEYTRHRVPDITLDVCEIFTARCSAEARDIRTSLAADERTIGKLVFTSYAQLQTPALQKRALDVIDQMSLEGFRSAGSYLTEFER